MNRLGRTALVAVMVASVVWLVACSDDAVMPETFGTVAFHLDHHVDGRTLQLHLTNEVLEDTTASGTLYNVTRLNYLISDVVLHSTSGEIYGMDGVHYRDHADDATRSFTIEDVPDATYDMVSFTFGLDEFKNIALAYDEEPWHFNMEWPGAMGRDQGLGYHYMKLEGNFDAAPDTNGYGTHTGARQMATDPVPFHHYFRVLLPIAATRIDGDNWAVTISMNINNWYVDPTPGDGYDSSYELSPQPIMANLAVQDKLRTNGPSCFSASIAASQ